jgi:hypothetical protein
VESAGSGNGPHRAALRASGARRAACGEMAAVVKVARAGTSVDMGPPLGHSTYDHDGLVVDYFLGTAWHAADTEALSAVQAVIDEGNPDPLALRQFNWDLTPFLLPGLRTELLRQGLEHLRPR